MLFDQHTRDISSTLRVPRQHPRPSTQSIPSAFDYITNMSRPSASSPPGDPLQQLTLRFLDSSEGNCPVCGYNVHRITASRCPECGRELRLRLVAVAPVFHLPWVILMMAACLGAGIGLFVGAIVLGEGIPPENDWRIVLTYFLFNIPLPLLVFLLLRPMRRLEGALAWIAPLLMVTATLVMAAWFLYKILHP